MLKYNLSIKQSIDTICSPLLNHLDLKFGYSRTYKDNKQFIIRSDLDLIEKLLNLDLDSPHIFYGKIITPPQDELIFALWNTKNTSEDKDKWDPYSKTFWECGYKIGISAVRFNQGYIEGWTFSPMHPIKDFDLFCIRNLEILRKFIKHFNNQASEFINIDTSQLQLLTYKNGFNFSLPEQNLMGTEQEHVRQFISEIGAGIKSRDGKRIKLSSQEVNCLDLLSKGNTIKQIAAVLHISPKTSEHHIYNIKTKTGYNLRSDLVNLYLEQVKK